MASGSDRFLPSRLFPEALCSNIFIRGECTERKEILLLQVMKYAAAIFFCLFAAGCGNKAAEGLLSSAERFVNDRPDSALQILRGIDAATLAPATDARRRLMLAQACNRAGQKLQSDSLIRPALDYYERSGHGTGAAYAWYYYAQAHHNAGDLKEAIRGYTQATLYAERHRQSNGMSELLGALYHTLGLLYLAQGYDTEAEEIFTKAIAVAQERDDAELEGYSRFMLSSAQYTAGRYAKAIETLAPLIEARDTLAFRFFAQQITLQNLIYHTFAEDLTPEQLLEERARIDPGEIRTAPLTHGTASADDNDRTLYDIASAVIFYRAGQTDSARYYIDRSLAQISHFDRNNVGLYTIASAIHHQRGEDSRALSYAMEYIDKRDSIDQAQRGALVAELEKKYRTANETALREAGLRYRAWIATLACLLLAGAIAWAVVGYRRKLRRRDAQLSEYLALLDSYRESHDSLTSRLDASDEREAAVKRSLESRFALLRDIASTYYTYGESQRLTAKMKELALSPAMLADIVRMADLYNDEAVTRLRRQLPGWTARNYDFAALVIAGFSPQEISVMLDMTLNGVYTLKSKLKRRLAESPAADKAFFIRFFQ